MIIKYVQVCSTKCKKWLGAVEWDQVVGSFSNQRVFHCSVLFTRTSPVHYSVLFSHTIPSLFFFWSDTIPSSSLYFCSLLIREWRTHIYGYLVSSVTTRYLNDMFARASKLLLVKWSLPAGLKEINSIDALHVKHGGLVGCFSTCLYSFGSAYYYI